MTDLKIKDHTNGRTIPVDSRADGEDKLQQFSDLKLELQTSDGSCLKSNFGKESEVQTTDGGTVENPGETEIVEMNDDEQVPGVDVCNICGREGLDDGYCPDCEEDSKSKELPETKPGVDEDPLNWVPGHFTDKIQGVDVLNRKAYAVLCERYNVSVTAEPVTLASESDFEYAEFRAIATTADGQEYSGFGSAHVDRGDDKHLLAELAETRALKRAASWATGVGMTAIEELQGGMQ